MNPIGERFWGIQLKDGSLLKGTGDILRWKDREDVERALDFRKRFHPSDIGSVVATKWITYIEIADSMEALDE